MNSSVLPLSVMKLPGFAVSQSNKDVIIDHLISQEGAGPALTEQQQEILNRWNEADDLMRSLKFTYQEICNLLCKKFGYSLATAKRDIEDTRDVFGLTRRPKKRYLLGLHPERIEAAIVLAQKSGKLELLPKLFDCYTNACKLLPEDDDKRMHPSAIIFNITTNNYKDITTTEITAAEAAATVAKRMAEWGIEVEDIMHEEVTDE